MGVASRQQWRALEHMRSYARQSMNQFDDGLRRTRYQSLVLQFGLLISLVAIVVLAIWIGREETFISITLGVLAASAGAISSYLFALKPELRLAHSLELRRQLSRLLVEVDTLSSDPETADSETATLLHQRIKDLLSEMAPGRLPEGIPGAVDDTR